MTPAAPAPDSHLHPLGEQGPSGAGGLPGRPVTPAAAGLPPLGPGTGCLLLPSSFLEQLTTGQSPPDWHWLCRSRGELGLRTVGSAAGENWFLLDFSPSAPPAVIFTGERPRTRAGQLWPARFGGCGCEGRLGRWERALTGSCPDPAGTGAVPAPGCCSRAVLTPLLRRRIVSQILALAHPSGEKRASSGVPSPSLPPWVRGAGLLPPRGLGRDARARRLQGLQGSSAGGSQGWATLPAAGCPTSLMAQGQPSLCPPRDAAGTAPLQCGGGSQSAAWHQLSLVCWLVGAPVCFRSSSWTAPVQFWLQLICSSGWFLYRLVSALVSGPAQGQLQLSYGSISLQLSSWTTPARFSSSSPVAPVHFMSSSRAAPACSCFQHVLDSHWFRLQLSFISNGSSLFAAPVPARSHLQLILAAAPLSSAPALYSLCLLK